MIDRRDFLKMGGFAALGMGMNLAAPGIFQRSLLAGQGLTDKKMIFIFLRGGNDAANTVIPRGDSAYSPSLRPSLFIPESNAIDLNGFAQFHPALAPLMEIYQANDLAVLHRVGYEGQSQSHFDSQQFWETGQPDAVKQEEGMIYRKVLTTMNPAQHGFVAAGLSDAQLLSLRGDRALPVFRSAEDFTIDGSKERLRKFIGEPPTAPGGADGSGLLGLYGCDRDFPDRPYRELVYGAGESMVRSVRTVVRALREGEYKPSNGAEYPDSEFGDQLLEIALLMKRTPVRIMGVDLTGWDTHSGQGGLDGWHPYLLNELARGIQALHRDLQDQWQDLLIITMSEFGRTSDENGSQGTDHGYGGVMFAAGGGVTGGVYNCDPTTWADGDLLSQDERYIQMATDYRAVFAEVFTRHFADDPNLIEQFIPGYSKAAGANPAYFQPLEFIA